MGLLDVSSATIAKAAVGLLLNEAGEIGIEGPSVLGRSFCLRSIFTEQRSEMECFQLRIKLVGRGRFPASTPWRNWS